jgi:hypothetical protein
MRARPGSAVLYIWKQMAAARVAPTDQTCPRSPEIVA